MRIIAGEARGRRLAVPAGQTTRPTADRIREAIFNLLGQRLDGEVVLDLFAGSGAMGLEALSRGASAATFVDRDREAFGICQANLEALGFSERGQVLRMDAIQAVRLLARKGARFDIAFVDPPYDAAPGPFLEALGAEALVGEGGVVVAEHDAKWSAEARYGLLLRRDVRRYGSTAVTLFEAESEAT